MNRRELLKGLMAGGMIVAGELWVPGAKMISIPSKKFYSAPILFELNGQTIKYMGPVHKTVTVSDFYDWIKTQFPRLMESSPYDTEKPHMVSLRAGYRIENPEHLVEGTLAQDRENSVLNQAADREYWSCTNTLSDDDLSTDKIYAYSTPRERISEDDMGNKGWR